MKNTIAIVCILLASCASVPKPKNVPGPHVFYAGVALYLNKHPIGLAVSKDRFLSCRDALDDTRSIIAKVEEEGDSTHSAIGVCIPIPVYDASDLVPQALY